nr:hypothetical protein [Tanacetum cinerariifolium]
DEQSGRTVTITTEDIQRKKNDVKARTTLLLFLPDEHQLRFSKYKTAKELWAAILKTFGGNEATKKRKKNLLKQQYGNFKAERSKTLEQTFNRLQVIVSQLQFMDVEVEKDDLNQKFLTSLAPEWLMHTIVWRNRNDLDTMSLDDLYNHLKVYEAKVQTKSNSNSQNMAFISSSKNSSGNEDGWDCSYMANKGEDHALVADAEDPTEFTLMANTKSKVFDNSLCSNDCKKNNDSLNSKIKDLTGELSEANNYIYHYKLAVAQLKGRLVEYKEREVKCIEKIRTLEMYRASNLKCIKTLDKELEELKLEKDGLDGKLAGLLKASKNLDNLIESQRSDKVKEGVGYNAVPPPAADLYLSPKKDLSWTGLPEFVDDTVSDYSRPSPTVESTSAEGQNKDSSTFEDVASPNTPKPFVKFVKPKDTQSESPEFVLNKKACYNCGDFSHLANGCRKRVQRETSRSQNHAYIGPSHRSAGHRPHGAPMRPSHRSVSHRPHRASMRPSNRLAGHIPHGPSMNPIRPNMNGARPNRSFFIQAPSYETRPFLKSSAVKTQYRAPWVSTVNRNNPPVNRKFSTGKRKFSTVNRKFPTASRKFTTGSTKIHTADMGKKGKAIKSSACWTWNPSQKLSNKGPINNSVSVMFKKYTYIDTQGRLKSIMAWVPKEN